MRSDLLTILGSIYLNIAFARRARRERADTYHAHDLDTLLGAFLASRFSRARLVYDFHELYTEQFAPGVKTWPWYAWYNALERALARRAHLCLTVCDSLGEWLKRSRKVQSVLTVKNVPNFREAKTLHGKRTLASSDPVILYHGLYFRNRGLEQLIEAAQHLKKGRIVLRGYGNLEEDLRALVRQRGLEHRIMFAPPVGVTELVNCAAEADIGVGAFVPLALNTRFALPNKLFEYMMAGLAVVGTDLPEMRKIILGHHIGMVCRPGDPQDLARVLNDMLDNEDRLQSMKRNALAAAKSLYNWEVEQRVLLDAYESLQVAA